MSAGLPVAEVTCLTVSGANIFAGTYGGGIYISSNDGVNWTPANNGLTDLNLYSLGVSESNVYAGTMSGGVFLYQAITA